MQGQLANSLQNKEVVPLERKVDADIVADYATNQMIGETVIRSEYNREILPRRLANIFDMLGPTRNRQNRPRILPTQARITSYSLVPATYVQPSINEKSAWTTSIRSHSWAHL